MVMGRQLVASFKLPDLGIRIVVEVLRDLEISLHHKMLKIVRRYLMSVARRSEMVRPSGLGAVLAEDFRP